MTLSVLGGGHDRGLTSETVDALATAGAARTSPLSAINLHHFHGAAARVPLPATAFGIRQPASRPGQRDRRVGSGMHAVLRRLLGEAAAEGGPGVA